jgi:hypothetical protein
MSGSQQPIRHFRAGRPIGFTIPPGLLATADEMIE